jgi:hypothetical protein
VKTLLFRAGSVASLSPAAASACTLCYSETAQKVRAAIFGADLWQNIALTLLPFLVVLLIVALIYPGIPLRKRRIDPREEPGTPQETRV